MQKIQIAEKRRLGSVVYLWKGFKRLFGISPHLFRVTIDGQAYNRRVSEVVVANMGIAHLDPIRLNPDIRMDDGVLSVCFIRARNLVDYIRIVGKLISRNSDKTQQLDCENAFQRVQIHLDQPRPVQADGELIGYTPLKVDLVPAAAAFLLPA